MGTKCLRGLVLTFGLNSGTNRALKHIRHMDASQPPSALARRQKWLFFFNVVLLVIFCIFLCTHGETGTVTPVQRPSDILFLGIKQPLLMSSQFYLGFLYFPFNFYQDKKLKIYQGAKKNPTFSH